MRQVWDTITQFHMLEAGDRVLIGVSGGPDSVALLHLLYSKIEEYGISIHVVHVNHMLRPEADTEAQYVEALALQYHLPFRLYTVDVRDYAAKHGMSLEQAGHTVRFQCFRDAKTHWNINKLALGHHRDDRAESALLHIVQGCGLDGLTAMPPVDVWEVQDQSGLIRPLAQVSKEDILQYCKEQALHYFIDATNLEPEYLRNRIRLELLPQMEQYNPRIADALVRLQDSCSADLDYITSQVQDLWEQHGSMHDNSAIFPAEVFRIQHIAIQRRILRLMYQKWNGSTVNLSFAQIEQMRKIAMQNTGTQMLSLSDQAQFLRQYDLLQITAKLTAVVPSDTYIWHIGTQAELQIQSGVFSVQTGVGHPTASDSQYYTVFVDADCLADQLIVRSRQSGDEIALSGRCGHKTVKKLFIDKKIPKEERDTIPLVLSDDVIVWIPGVYLSETIRITGNTKRICKLCFSRR